MIENSVLKGEKKEPTTVTIFLKNKNKIKFNAPHHVVFFLVEPFHSPPNQMVDDPETFQWVQE